MENGNRGKAHPQSPEARLLLPPGPVQAIPTESEKSRLVEYQQSDVRISGVV